MSNTLLFCVFLCPICYCLFGSCCICTMSFPISKDNKLLSRSGVYSGFIISLKNESYSIFTPFTPLLKSKNSSCCSLLQSLNLSCKRGLSAIFISYHILFISQDFLFSCFIMQHRYLYVSDSENYSIIFPFLIFS